MKSVTLGCNDCEEVSDIETDADKEIKYCPICGSQDFDIIEDD